MGYLNKGTITVDAILTNRGRELLATSGRTSLNITKFSVADDEIDYSLWNEAHPNGNTYAGSIIENMPVLEATPDEQQIMRYKLVSLDNATAFGSSYYNATTQALVFPKITGFQDAILVSAGGGGLKTLDIATDPRPNNQQEPYVVLLGDATLIEVYRQTADSANLLTIFPTINPQTGLITNSGTYTVAANGSASFMLPTVATGTQKLVFKRIVDSAGNAKTGTTTITIFGERTGATATQTITVS